MSFYMDKSPGNFVYKIVCEEEKLSQKNASFLTKFSNGRMDPEKSTKVKFYSYQNCETSDGLQRKKIKKILVADTEGMQYAGYNFGTLESQRRQHYKYYVGVVNKKSNKVTVHNTEIFHCKPILNTSRPVQIDDESEKSISIKMDELTASFGSRVMKKAMQSRLRYVVGDDDIANEVLNVIDKSVADNELDQTVAIPNSFNEPQVAQVIPPQNMSATEANDVYKLSDVISPEVYQALDELSKPLTDATKAMVDKWKTESAYSCFVLQQFEQNSKIRNCHKVKLLLYYDFITQLLKLKYTDFRKKNGLLPLIPEPFKTDLLDRFTSLSTSNNNITVRSMPLKMKDKAMSYAMILALWVEDLSVDIQPFMVDFKCGITKATNIAHALGCHIVSQKSGASSAKVIQLKLPLYTPSVKYKKR